MVRHRVAALALLVGVALALFGSAAPVWAQADAPVDTGVQIDGTYGPFLPTDVSEHGYQIDRLIHWLHAFMAVLFVGWGIFFVYCLVRFRQRAGQRANCEPIKAKPSKYSEIGVAIFEAVLLIGFSMPVWASLKTDLPEPEDNPTRVRVMAEQFAWNFHYPGPDGKFGRTAPEFVNLATNPLGLDPGDAAGEDDIYSVEMHIPTDVPVLAELTSRDVIHSFFIPVMRIKQDTIPGMRIPVWFKPKKEGVYEIACAQLCGNNHYSMRALLHIRSQEAYEAWLEEKSAPPELFDEDDL